jgi:ketosteroid isomerase-like protein
MTDDQVRTKFLVQERLIDYWWDVDRNEAKNALDFYTDDCVYLMCDQQMKGHSAIEAYYRFREARGRRLVRHVLTNVRVRITTEDCATVDGVLSVYANDGVPVLPSAPPIMVADTECEFMLGADGKWRMRTHQITALFTGGVKVLVPPT